MAGKLYGWLDTRLKLKPLEHTLLDEAIPGGANWIYVFGSATLFLFCLQAVTGMFLALYYVPSPDAAYDTVQFIQQEVQFGWFVRGLHHWGASAVMLAVGLHLLQVYLYGAYKRPRELMWMVGVGLLLLMLIFGFTGYLLPWDQNAYWATQVGSNMAATVPVIGDILVRLLRGGENLGALTLSRFFALHTLFLPALIISGILLHLFILRRVGPAGPWNEEEARRTSETFYPRQVYMDAVVMLGLFIVLVVLAGTIEFPLADRADPADNTFTPVPEWYFLFYYQLLKYVSGPLEPLATWGLPTLFVLGLLLLPFLDRSRERRPSSRPVAVLVVSVFLLTVFGLLGVSIRDLRAVPKVDPSVARGRLLFEQHHCLACHTLHGQGGKMGPDLSYVGNRRTDREWHIRHLRDPAAVSPGSIMPKFPLSDREANDLASFLLNLKGEPPTPTAGARERPEPAYAPSHADPVLHLRTVGHTAEAREGCAYSWTHDG